MSLILFSISQFKWRHGICLQCLNLSPNSRDTIFFWENDWISMEICTVGTFWDGKMKENCMYAFRNCLTRNDLDSCYLQKLIDPLETKNPCKYAIFLLCHERLMTFKNKSTQGNCVVDWLHHIDNPGLLLGDLLHKIE